MDKKSIYGAFDVYPSAKGAATHIYHMVETLFEFSGQGTLYCLGNQKLPKFQKEENGHEIARFDAQIPNYLKRAELYSGWLLTQLKKQDDLHIGHFRDIWSGLGILKSEKAQKTVFEVNALTSIELPFRYNFIPQRTLEKIEQLEKYCLESVDRIIVPSAIIKENLLKRADVGNKITVISNGADLQPPLSKPIEAPKKYLLYFGALQDWQGIDTLLKAFKTLQDIDDLHLVIISSNRNKFAKHLKKFAHKLELERIHWFAQLPKEELYAWIQHAYLSLAPLKECSRNIDQGCSPLKIFESLANGTAVVASDLPVVREIVSEESACLVRPDRPGEFGRAIRELIDFPEQRNTIARNGREVLERNFLWQQKKTQLQNLYLDLFKN